MPEIEEWLQENYRALQAESGRAWEDMAAEMRDSKVAAWMRSQVVERSQAPKARSRQPKSEG